MLVRLVVLRPALRNLEVSFILVLFCHLGVVPVLLRVYLVREFLLACLCKVHLFELALRALLLSNICQSHHVILCPELLALLQLEA